MPQLLKFLLVLVIAQIKGDLDNFRPPAVPLIVFSPHISVWSFTDSLTDSDTVHWSGTPLAFHGLIDIDNAETYRFLGTLPSNITSLVQNQLVVQPWRTIYNFSTPTNTVELVLSFSQPISIDDPYTYITFDVRTLDDKPHHVRIYFDEGPRLSIFGIGEKVYWSRTDGEQLIVLTMNAMSQIPFGIRGDMDLKNDWGYAYLISGNTSISTGHQGFGDDLRQAFVNHQSMPNDDQRKPRHADDQPPTSAFILNLGEVSSQTVVSAYVVFLYDDVYSMLYFDDWQAPCWRTELDNNVTLLINESVEYYEENMNEITVWNDMLMRHLRDVGGEEYERLCSLVTRQITGSLSRTWSDRYNRSQLYMKEISSGGYINKIDVIFPSSVYFLLVFPEMLRDLLLPILAYVHNDTCVPYDLNFAPHHLGLWPIGDWLVSEQQRMPMEESGNIFLMLAALVQKLNTTDFLQPYWNMLEVWAQYLNSTLPDPQNQFCPDDFEGPSPHNCNLALKGILGLGAYSILLNATGQTERSILYLNQARDYVNYWMKTARDENNYRLQYDLPNTWSQKYNLIYENILSLNLFPSDVAKLESDYYQTKMVDYGIPLDSRSNLTKADWTSWIAAFADDQQANVIFSKLYKYANETPDRVPISDMYNAVTGGTFGFQARPVMGGLFARALTESSLLKNKFLSLRSPLKKSGRLNKCNLK